MLEISKINVFTNNHATVKANASVVFGDCLRVTGFKLINGRNGLFLSMPSNKVGDQYKDIAYPTNKEFRSFLEEKIIEEYNNVLSSGGSSQESSSGASSQGYSSDPSPEDDLPF